MRRNPLKATFHEELFLAKLLKSCNLKRMKMDDDFPYEEKLPRYWDKSPLVEKIGIRHYLVKSEDLRFYHWINQLNAAYPQNLLPLQWAASYIGVSRSSVFKRIKRGGLTVFSYEFEEGESVTILGDKIVRDTKNQFDYVLISECLEWQSRLYDRAMRSEKPYDEGLNYFSEIKKWLKFMRKPESARNDEDREDEEHDEGDV
jgi:hypothetical protein